MLGPLPVEEPTPELLLGPVLELVLGVTDEVLLGVSSSGASSTMVQPA